MALEKPLDSITTADLQALITDAVPEGKTIDYKEILPGNSRDDKKEFLADVSSFANASGGHLVFGMREDAGVAVELRGIQGIDPDAEILRLENMLRDGIAPRIPAISVRAIPWQPSGVAIVINIPRSWAQPHVVDFQGHWRFYSRNSAGKYSLDIAELRSSFTLSETLTERIRGFRTERLGKIIAGETPVPMEKTAKIVLHLVPIGAFDPTAHFNVAALANDTGQLSPMYASGWNYRHNFDGLLTYSSDSRTSSALTYLQIFRNGSIEAVETLLLRPEESRAPFIPSVAYEKALIESLPRFLAIQSRLGVTPPVIIMLSLLGVAGYTMAVDRSRVFSSEQNPIDRNELILPDILIEDMNSDAGAVLRPSFDAIWNAAGWSKSINYDKDGTWVGH